MALLTSYSDANKIILQGKTQRITCGEPLSPLLTVNYEGGSLSSDNPSISATVDTWYEMICNSTAQFAYVGMTYDAAASCRNAMIKKFTRQKTIWEYTTKVELGKVFIGWDTKGTGTVQEAEVNLTPMGGHMYQVIVNVDCQDIKMTKEPQTTTFSYPPCMSDVD